MNYKSTGIVLFSPTRVIEKENINNPCWCILSCDDELSRYYRHVVERTIHRKLSAPKWGAHITVIREEIINENFLKNWKLFDRNEIQFKYQGKIQTNLRHWWLNVQCEELSAIRESLGLEKSPEIEFHLTIGWSNYELH